MQKPVVAMIDGVAARAGMRAAPACDFRIMITTSKLIQASSSNLDWRPIRVQLFSAPTPQLYEGIRACCVMERDFCRRNFELRNRKQSFCGRIFFPGISKRFWRILQGAPTKAHSLMKREKIFLRQRRLTEVLNMKFTCRKLLFKRTTRSRESMLLLKNGRSL